MKIGIVGSGFDMLPLMQFLSKQEHEVHFFVDRSHRPWGDKSSELRQARIQEGVKYLEKLGVDTLILPPLAEKQITSKKNILPLFETYLQEYAFKHSLVGKIGLLCEQADIDGAEELITSFGKSYSPSESQSKTKKFKHPFSLWKKNVRMWTYFLTTYGRREPMLRKTLKHDLAYFSDAGIDTLVPMSWGFLFYQKIIKKRINRKKMRFHGLKAVHECFTQLTQDSKSSSYSITLHCTDTPTPILEEKKWMKVLSRGGDVEVKVELV